MEARVLFQAAQSGSRSRLMDKGVKSVALDPVRLDRVDEGVSWFSGSLSSDSALVWCGVVGTSRRSTRSRGRRVGDGERAYIWVI
jgi:hypothetical protein